MMDTLKEVIVDALIMLAAWLLMTVGDISSHSGKEPCCAIAVPASFSTSPP